MEKKDIESTNEILNIREILDNANPAIFSKFKDKTLTTITTDIFDILRFHNINESFGKNLTGYQYIDKIYQLERGRYIRWISLIPETDKRTLTNGSNIVEIKFLDKGTHILCKNAVGRFIQIRMDNCLLFQKLTPEEQCILLTQQNP